MCRLAHCRSEGVGGTSGSRVLAPLPPCADRPQPLATHGWMATFGFGEANQLLAAAQVFRKERRLWENTFTAHLPDLERCCRPETQGRASLVPLRTGTHRLCPLVVPLGSSPSSAHSISVVTGKSVCEISKWWLSLEGYLAPEAACSFCSFHFTCTFFISSKHCDAMARRSAPQQKIKQKARHFHFSYSSSLCSSLPGVVYWGQNPPFSGLKPGCAFCLRWCLN